MACLCCGAGSEVGALCRSCANDVAPCEGLIPDHVRSTVSHERAAAWVVDGFGTAHPIAARTTLGRSQDGELILLAASVSREHAEIRKSDAGWHIRDLGSRNGVLVDGARAQGRVLLPARCVIKAGDVALWFLAETTAVPANAASVATQSAGSGLVRFMLAAGDVELCLVGTTDADAGGALLSRAAAATSWSETALSPLEFHLLRSLAQRATEDADSPSSVRGCVPTKQLARDLPFQSKYANEENVRQVVRRVRAILGELGAESALAVAPGRGYYLTCAVSSASSDRR